MSLRPVYYFNNDKTCEIKAGGVLFYIKKNYPQQSELLLISSQRGYEDFGGCTDICDNDIIDTIAREVEEESNGIFNKKYIREQINNLEPIYIIVCKYVLYLVELKEYHDPSIFGNIEIHDNIERTVEWVKFSELYDKKLNFRLKNFSVMNKLKKIFSQ